jgi:cobyrinic acid a,c-diamide synthase
MARSAAALLQGFENFDPELNFAGVIFNKIGSENHLDYLTQAMAGHVKMPCLGGIIRDEHIEIPERHLGLVTNDEHLLPRSDIEHLSDIIDNRIDTCRLFKGLVRYRGLSQPKNQQQTPGQNKKNKIKIAVARDKAFCFYYQDNLDLLEKQGAELVYFSPVLDRQLPEEVHGIILGGGYPEVFAAQLSENSTMMAAIKDKSMKGMPIYAECGGFMYLCNSITDHENQYYNMTGCFPFDTRMLKKRKALGYRKITFSRDCIHGRKGMVARGHEFHYSEIDGGMDGNDLKRVYSLEPKKGEKSLFEGYLKGNTFGSYIHLHFGSNPELCRHFIQSALTYQKLETHET